MSLCFIGLATKVARFLLLVMAFAECAYGIALTGLTMFFSQRLFCRGLSACSQSAGGWGAVACSMGILTFLQWALGDPGAVRLFSRYQMIGDVFCRCDWFHRVLESRRCCLCSGSSAGVDQHSSYVCCNWCSTMAVPFVKCPCGCSAGSKRVSFSLDTWVSFLHLIELLCNLVFAACVLSVAG